MNKDYLDIPTRTDWEDINELQALDLLYEKHLASQYKKDQEDYIDHIDSFVLGHTRKRNYR